MLRKYQKEFLEEFLNEPLREKFEGVPAECHKRTAGETLEKILEMLKIYSWISFLKNSWSNLCRNCRRIPGKISEKNPWIIFWINTRKTLQRNFQRNLLRVFNRNYGWNAKKYFFKKFLKNFSKELLKEFFDESSICKENRGIIRNLMEKRRSYMTGGFQDWTLLSLFVEHELHTYLQKTTSVKINSLIISEDFFQRTAEGIPRKCLEVPAKISGKIPAGIYGKFLHEPVRKFL